jgi:3-phosphoshikimate 1-carboxyvinyltransferase
MAELRVRPGQGWQGALRVPGDKSVSHRALILGALAEGTTRVRNWLPAQDCWSTRRCLAALGTDIAEEDGELVVRGRGPAALREPEEVLDCGNAGTAMRLLLGVLAGLPVFAVLDGDGSLRRRPMRRVTEPLARMGARVDGRRDGALAPVAIRGGRLRGIRWRPQVASAQVKSAILLAGLLAEGETVVEEPAATRDHTERMLRGFGARVDVDGTRVALWGGQRLTGRVIDVPGDLSAAAFLLGAAAILPGSRVTVPAVGVNPGRTGFLDVLAEMGAEVTLTGAREATGEPVADVTVAAPAGGLRGVRVAGELVPRLVDEVPILAVVAAFARGETVIADAADLRAKESDRLSVMAERLARMGADVEERPDGLRVRGGRPLHGAELDSAGDHRVAMALAVAALGARGETVIGGAESVAVSFPGFAAAIAAFSGSAAG